MWIVWISLKKLVELREVNVNKVFGDNYVEIVNNFLKTLYTKVLFVGKFVDNVDMLENLRLFS